MDKLNVCHKGEEKVSGGKKPEPKLRNSYTFKTQINWWRGGKIERHYG